MVTGRFASNSIKAWAVSTLVFVVLGTAGRPAAEAPSQRRVRLQWDWTSESAPRPGAPRRRVPMIRDFTERQVISPEVVPSELGLQDLGELTLLAAIPAPSRPALRPGRARRRAGPDSRFRRRARLELLAQQRQRRNDLAAGQVRVRRQRAAELHERLHRHGRQYRGRGDAGQPDRPQQPLQHARRQRPLRGHGAEGDVRLQHRPRRHQLVHPRSRSTAPRSRSTRTTAPPRTSTCSSGRPGPATARARRRP